MKAKGYLNQTNKQDKRKRLSISCCLPTIDKQQEIALLVWRKREVTAGGSYSGRSSTPGKSRKYSQAPG